MDILAPQKRLLCSTLLSFPCSLSSSHTLSVQILTWHLTLTPPPLHSEPFLLPFNQHLQVGIRVEISAISQTTMEKVSLYGISNGIVCRMWKMSQHSCPAAEQLSWPQTQQAFWKRCREPLAPAQTQQCATNTLLLLLRTQRQPLGMGSTSLQYLLTSLQNYPPWRI